MLNFASCCDRIVVPFFMKGMNTMESVVKIRRIHINNIKNVKSGEILSSFYNSNQFELSSEVIGIYGQNGSGKTALINALYILKSVMGCDMDKDSFNDDIYPLINSESKVATLAFDFVILKESKQFEAFYEFKIEKKDKTILIFDEKLSYKGIFPEKVSKVTIIETSREQDLTFLPKTRYDELISKNKQYKTDLIVSRKMAEKEIESFIFRKESLDIFTEGFDNENFTTVILALHYFAKMKLFVITNHHHSVIHDNMLLPLAFRYQKDETLSVGDFPIRFGENKLDKDEYALFKGIINQMSLLIHTIIPDMYLDLKEYGEVILENGQTGISVELMSKRNGISIPIKYESDGIKKIISILSALIAMYNSESICVAVDELDAGIFEYLLGEMLKVIKDSGKGQLIFTSHNLRPLEVLDKTSIYFTTTNPMNRYIQFSNIKNNNNLRDVYLRTIDLGGQKECVYQVTSAYDISRAFRLAGKFYEQ